MLVDVAGLERGYSDRRQPHYASHPIGVVYFAHIGAFMAGLVLLRVLGSGEPRLRNGVEASNG